jgi:hypothetical protein
MAGLSSHPFLSNFATVTVTSKVFIAIVIKTVETGEGLADGRE